LIPAPEGAPVTTFQHASVLAKGTLSMVDEATMSRYSPCGHSQGVVVTHSDSTFHP
jgi:hypothetical protein